MGFRLAIRDNLPVLELPDGRCALADTGCCVVEAIARAESGPVTLGDRVLHPVEAGIDLSAIARKIRAPRIDLLIGAPALKDGFSIDLDGRTFDFAATSIRADEEEIASLRWKSPELTGLLPPIVEVDIGGARRDAVFDTGAAFTLWKMRAAEPARAAQHTRDDFHLALDGTLVEYPVWSRTETLRLGEVSIELDVAYLPDAWPGLLPQLILGMDVPGALGASRLTLDPDSASLRFFRPRRHGSHVKREGE